MPSYSSDHFDKDWKYSVEKDFTSPLGQPIKHAHNGFRTWGSEKHKIPCSKPPGGACVNCDGSLIAVSVAETSISTIPPTSLKSLFVEVIYPMLMLRFKPDSPKVLVSSAQNFYTETHPVEPTIIVWNLDEQKENRMMKSSIILEIAIKTVVKNLLLAQPRLKISTKEKDSLTTAIEPDIATERMLEGTPGGALIRVPPNGSCAPQVNNLI